MSIITNYDLFWVIFLQSTNNLIELEVSDVLKFFENLKESDNIIYKFYSDKTNIKTEIIVTLTEGFPPFKFELELELKDASDVSILKIAFIAKKFKILMFIVTTKILIKYESFEFFTSFR